MKIKELMTRQVATCGPETPMGEVARLMLDNDCGMIPVVASNGGRKPVGAITDRDIVCRAVAKGQNPLEMKAADIMTSSPVTVSQNTSEQAAAKLMEDRQLRRLIVVDDNGDCAGVVAQADFARKAPEDETVQIVKEVSRPNHTSTSRQA